MKKYYIVPEVSIIVLTNSMSPICTSFSRGYTENMNVEGEETI